MRHKIEPNKPIRSENLLTEGGDKLAHYPPCLVENGWHWVNKDLQAQFTLDILEGLYINGHSSLNGFVEIMVNALFNSQKKAFSTVDFTKTKDGWTPPNTCKATPT